MFCTRVLISFFCILQYSFYHVFFFLSGYIVSFGRVETPILHLFSSMVCLLYHCLKCIHANFFRVYDKLHLQHMNLSQLLR